MSLIFTLAFWALCFGIGFAIAVAVVADARAERRYRQWREHPDQVWNLWKRDADDH